MFLLEYPLNCDGQLTRYPETSIEFLEEASTAHGG